MSAQFEGFEELQKKLTALVKKVDGQQFDAAMMVAGEVMADEMRRLVAVDDGGLKASIFVKPDKGRSQKIVRIGPRWPQGAHAHLVEFGTKARTTKPSRKKALFWAGAAHPMGMTRTGAMRARPFMRPAFDGSRQKALQTLADELERVIRP